MVKNVKWCWRGGREDNDFPLEVALYFMECTLTCAITMTHGNKGLPDGLFKGLRSLMYLSLNLCAYRNLPNMDDLTALHTFYGGGYATLSRPPPL